MLSHTSTEWAPWHVIPADHKWFARICVGAVLAHTLAELHPQFPVVSDDQHEDDLRARAELMAEAPPGAPADPYEGDEPSDSPGSGSST